MQKLKNNAKAIMIQGTGSGVGKSVLVSALCRIFLQDGYSVAPFKAQNMALNSFVTEDGGEIGRAQATQAQAAKIKPTTDMNPILIKPMRDRRAQIILQGKPLRDMSVYEYKNYKTIAFRKVKASFERLCQKYDIVVIEGAGSPAEINLRSHDLVNMKTAKLASAPVILAGDIDKGGVFAWLVGTLELLPPEERKIVQGFIINKFRGDKRLLRPGIRFLEDYTATRVLGTIPYYHNIKIPEEDSLPLESEREKGGSERKLKINVIYLPHISNFTDFDSLGREPDVLLKYARRPEDLREPDAIIIPGTKNTIGDFEFLKKSGFAEKILSFFHSRQSMVLIGVCGGYQMLGERIFDRNNTESKMKETEGLKVLPITTEFYPDKILSQVKAKDLFSGMEVAGYEIHHGRTKLGRGVKPRFEINSVMNKKARRPDGAQIAGNRCWGTYIHGIFDNDAFRRHFLNELRKKRGWPVLTRRTVYNVDKEIDKLAQLVRENIDLNLLYEIVFKGNRR